MREFVFNWIWDESQYDDVRNGQGTDGILDGSERKYCSYIDVLYEESKVGVLKIDRWQEWVYIGLDEDIAERRVPSLGGTLHIILLQNSNKC